jgi:molybdopterin converting factor small subunit
MLAICQSRCAPVGYVGVDRLDWSVRTEPGLESSRDGSSIHVQVRFGSSLAVAMGSAHETVLLPEGATVGDLVAQLLSRHPRGTKELRSSIAVLRGSHSPWTAALEDRAEVTLLVPYAGG